MPEFDYADAERFFWRFMAGEIRGYPHDGMPSQAARAYLIFRELPESVLPGLTFYFDDIDSGDH
jgi:hypothetical protein